MPIYEYQCLSCGKRTEQLQRLDDPPLAACPQCGGEVKKLISAPAVQFKGSGWYVTDYAGKKGGGASASKSDKSEGSAVSSSSEGSASDSSAAKPAESKPSGSSGGGSGSSD
ncbi:MAG TPA: FmdB family zinc ribbon protein [Thermoanaerobaculia bacterium]|nr:FmdB family zinc ribbon protein [Thermoanaerobaculia bacterium]